MSIPSPPPRSLPEEVFRSRQGGREKEGNMGMGISSSRYIASLSWSVHTLLPKRLSRMCSIYHLFLRIFQKKKAFSHRLYVRVQLSFIHAEVFLPTQKRKRDDATMHVPYTLPSPTFPAGMLASDHPTKACNHRKKECTFLLRKRS